ncbi:MAG: aldehyde dehydrogenase family protein [Phaeodactylibacter sp.]|nr:aldehyde dehydrogenase family protein [Phaeodactylibacter sp.]MCB9266966.1 aldehyde dehydrogenase family protein [Lewinellaceae bacterium]MCB9287968.1 aldehyde dehydrogenase family protein [Lewinellaceae bacterium]
MTAGTTDTSRQEIRRIFEAQRANQAAVAKATARERIAKLRRLHKTLLHYRQEIRDALYKDFQKPPLEVDLTEIYIITSEIKHTIRNLRRWMKPQNVGTPLPLLGSRSYIQYQPKGVVLIIAPWNFPVNLTFTPMVSAIAAGNCVMLKPSENTPHSSAIMAKIVEELFPENEVALVEGAVETSKALLDLPFNHIFFTGSPAVGKIVMQAAAKNLASVTLELGGKSPTIVDETADLEKAAARIAWGKHVNMGQTCIAPDYLLVHESCKEELLKKISRHLNASYGEAPQNSPDYPRIVNRHHFERVKASLQEALEKGARAVIGGQMDDASRFIAPTVVAEIAQDSRLMTEEIFGPVLPVIGFRSLQEAIDRINSREKPLALYLFSKNRKNIRQVLNHTRAGTTCINNSLLQFNNINLPFGGDNNSGIGKSHGWFGFEAFSNARSVYQQIWPLSTADLLRPPYNAWKQKLADWTLKWL